MRYRIVHRTEYEYGSEVAESFNEARMLPRDLLTQRCLERRLRIVPAPADYQERDDFFGNRVASFAHHRPHRRLVVEATSVVETNAVPPPGLLSAASWETVVQRVHHDTDSDTLSARQFVLDSPLVSLTPALASYARESFVPGRPFAVGGPS